MESVLIANVRESIKQQSVKTWWEPSLFFVRFANQIGFVISSKRDLAMDYELLDK